MSAPPDPPTPTEPETPVKPGENENTTYQLPVAGFKGTPDEIEQQWYERCYVGRGDSMWQLTWRAVLMGSVLGGILSLTNLYIGLKSGWGFGVAITACILSYAVWTTMHKIGLVKSKMTVLENNCMQSTASSAGYSTGGTLVSAIAAYILVNNATLSIPVMMAWVFFLAILGVSMAIPMKRQMINIEQLRFPSGIAAAETLNALHTTGGKGMASAKALGIAGLLAVLSKFWTSGLHLIPGLQKLELEHLLGHWNTAIFGKASVGRTVMLGWEPMFIAAGAITGIRVCASMLIGGTLCWVFLVPWALNNEVIPLTIKESLPVLPAEVRLEDHPELKNIAYVNYARRLEWKGVMSAEEREGLLAISEESSYQLAIRRLYVRSQFRAAEPLSALPAGVTPGDLPETVKFDPSRGLVANEILSTAQYRELRGLSPNAGFVSAVDALYERSRLESAEPLWSSAKLAALPSGVRAPKDLEHRFAHDEDAGVLLWHGAMSDDERDAILALSDKSEYQEAVNSLHAATAAPALPVALPAEAAGVVAYDASTGMLRAIGPIPNDLVARLEGLNKDAGYQRTLAALADSSQSPRASENFSDLVRWSLWGGASCMVTSALFSFALQWRSVVRALAGLGSIFGRRKKEKADGFRSIETPTSWFLGGQIVGGIGIVILAYYTFGMPIWQSVLAILLSFFLAIVACRVCGETDTTPVGAMGKVTQLIYGAISPASASTSVSRAMNVNLMSACITAGAADSASDLLIDLKSGYMLGANPRKQFIAQFAGIFMGTLASVLAFSLVVPNADALGTAQFPAPAAQTWAAVAKLLGEGFSSLHSTAVWAIIIGGSVGILLPLLERIMPKYKAWVPSAAGLGLAFTFAWYYSLLFFIGAVIGLVIEKKYPKVAEDFTFPVASGVIAGEALMGVGLIFWENGPQMLEQLVKQFAGG